MLNDLAKVCHEASRDRGWWPLDNTNKVSITPELIGAKIALIHSEVSEALEAYRKSSWDHSIPGQPAITVELADTLIRIFDLAGALNLDLDTAFPKKLEFNRTRQDHSLEARQAPGGKIF